MSETATATEAALRLVILMPVFEDFEAACLVCQALDQELAKLPSVSARVLLVDDGSPSRTKSWSSFPCKALERIDVLSLRRNLGHQRAIAVGLCQLADAGGCDAVLVMDADGEDRPGDLPRLVAEFRRTSDMMIFAERRKRMEGFVFQLGYFSYRTLHRLLTGIPVRAGNFSLLPASALPRLVCMSELWNHYAGAALRSRLPQRRVPLDRGSRVLGRSQMGGLIGLVMHGIAGIATFHDVVATRLLVGSVAVMGVLGAAIGAVVAIRLATTLAIPGWATYVAGLLLMLSVQVSTVAFSLVLSLVSARTSSTFVPVRDAGLFVEGMSALGGRHVG